MTGSFRPTFWILSGLAAITGIMAIITPFAPDWIEVVLGWDPDQHGGSVERLIVIGFCRLTAVLFILAALEWQRTRPAGSA